MEALKELIIDKNKTNYLDYLVNGLINYQIPEKCKYCDYYFNYLCRANKCVRKEGDENGS